MVSNKFLGNLLSKRNRLRHKLFLYVGKHQNGELTYQTQIKEHFKIPYTTINYHITKFKEEGLIDNHLNLTNTGIKLFKLIWKDAGIKKLRAHNIQIKFNLIKCPINYVKKYSRDIFKTFTNGRYYGFKGDLGNFTFMFYSKKKIICVLKDIFGNNDEEITSSLMILIGEIKNILEKEFLGIKIEAHNLAKIQTMHIAVLDSYISENYNLRGFTYESKTMAIDESKGRYELESTNSETCLEDCMKLLKIDKNANSNR